MTGNSPAPLLLDLSHTCHSRARTGIQRVVRSLHKVLGENAVAVTHDPFADAWRPLEPWENANLDAAVPARKRGARWPLTARLRSRAARVLGRRPPPLPANGGLVVPEVFSPIVARALPRLFTATSGPRVAIFHDAIALKLPELTPQKTVGRFPAYLVELLAFDGIAAISDESRVSLLDYWAWLGVRDVPPVETIGWGVDLPADPAVKSGQAPDHPLADARSHGADPVILSVGSIEGRKNHLALLEACEQLWTAGEKFQLHLIGLAQPQTGGAALARISALQAAGRPLRYDGPVPDAAVGAAFAACTFTVYPSLMEGFGLPVLESVARGKPCICSSRGALGESARGGGCVMIDPVNAANLGSAIKELLRSPPRLAGLCATAAERTFKSWSQYAAELRGWMRTVQRRK